MTSTALVQHHEPQETQDLIVLCTHLAKSGMFSDARDVSKAIVKVLAGKEYGFGPIASMVGIHVIEGKPSLGANLLASLIKRSGKYDFRVIELTRERCDIAFFYRDHFAESTDNPGEPKVTTKRPMWVLCGPNIVMTMQEAKDTGLALDKTGRLKSNWARHSDDMLFARCISKGYRRYCPDLAGGMLTYVTDELQENINDDRFDEAIVATCETSPEQPTHVNGHITPEQWQELEPMLRERPGYSKRLLPVLGIDRYSDMPQAWLPLVKEIIQRFKEPLEFQSVYLDSKALSEVDLLKRELVLKQLQNL